MAEFTQVGVEAVVKGINKFTSDIAKMNVGLDNSSDAIVSLEGAVDNLNDTFDELLSDQLSEMKRQTALLARVVDNTANPAIDEFEQETDDASESADKFGLNLDGVAEKARGFGAGVSNLTQILVTGLGTALGNLITGGLNLIKDAFVEAGRAAFDFTKESVNMAAEFQDQVTILDIAAGDATDEFGSLKDIALAVGGDIRLAGISASGAAEGMTELFKAGLDTTAIFGDLNAFMEEGADLGGALRASIDLAAASELELGESASLAAVVLSTFGDAEADAATQAKFVNDALNTMVKAADASVADVSDLAAALTNVGPTAAAAGLDITEVNTALAILSTRGITGAEAGTALKSAIANMRRPTAQVQGELEKWGIQLFDAEGNMFDFVNIIGQFEVALADATDEQKAQAIQTIAGTFGMNAMNALLGEGVEGWADMQEAMANAATIQEQAAAKTATYSGIVEALDGTMETLKIQIGDALLPVLSDLAIWFTGLADRFGPAVISVVSVIGENLQNFAKFMIDAVAGGKLLDRGLLSSFPTFAQPMIETLARIVMWLKDFIPQAIQFLSDIWTNTLLPAIQNVWSFITTTLIPVFQTIWSWLSQLLAGAITFLVGEWEQILLPALMKLQELWISTILPALTELWSWLQVVIPVAIENLTSFWNDTLLPVLVTVWSWIIENLFPVFAEIVAWMIENIPTAIQGLATLWTNTLQPAIMKVWEAFKENILPVFEDVWEWMEENLPGAIETLKAFWEETLKPALEVVWAFITETLIPAFADIQVWLSEKVPVAIQIAKTFWEETLKPALEVVWTFIQESIIPIFEDVFEWLSVTIPAAIETAKTFWEETLKPALETVWAFISEYLLPLWEALEEFLSVTLTLALNALAGLWENILLPAMTLIWEGIKLDLMPILENLKNFITLFLAPAFQSFKQNQIDKWKESFEKVKTAIGNFTEKIIQAKDHLLGLKLPDWLEFNSPPPLFYALQYINKEMDELTSRQLPRMQVELQAISPFGAGMVAAPIQAMAGPMMAAQNVTQRTVNINQTNNINSGMSQSAFDARVENSVNRALG